MISKTQETPLSIFYRLVEWLVYRYSQNHCNTSILRMLIRFADRSAMRYYCLGSDDNINNHSNNSNNENQKQKQKQYQ